MGCTPLCNAMCNVIQRLRSKARKRKSLKGHHHRSRSEDRIARSVNQGKGSPIRITHLSDGTPNTTLAPLPPTALPPPTHVETKEIVKFQCHEPDTDLAIHSSNSGNEMEWSRHEPASVTYSSRSPGLSSAHEDSSKRDCFYWEYQHYPTPVRDGIYNLTIDSSRLSTIFSDENPNACSIS